MNDGRLTKSLNLDSLAKLYSKFVDLFAAANYIPIAIMQIQGSYQTPGSGFFKLKVIEKRYMWELHVLMIFGLQYKIRHMLN